MRTSGCTSRFSGIKWPHTHKKIVMFAVFISWMNIHISPTQKQSHAANAHLVRLIYDNLWVFGHGNQGRERSKIHDSLSMCSRCAELAQARSCKEPASISPAYLIYLCICRYTLLHKNVHAFSRTGFTGSSMCFCVHFDEQYGTYRRPTNTGQTSYSHRLESSPGMQRPFVAHVNQELHHYLIPPHQRRL